MRWKDNFYGNLVVGYKTEDYYSLLKKFFFGLISLALFFSVFVVMFVSLFSYRIVRPINQISTGLANNDLTPKNEKPDFKLAFDNINSNTFEVSTLINNLETYKKLLVDHYETQTELKKHKLEIDKLRSFTRAVQMITHDLKKPIMMVKMIVNKILSDPSSGNIRTIANNYIPYISTASSKAENLIHDILLGGENISINQAPTEIEKIIIKCFEDNASLFREKYIDFSYNFKHNHKLNVDEFKIIRVFSNIVSNALESSKRVSKIWFYSNDSSAKEGFLEIVIGNNNSYIDQSRYESIFELFYTYGKDQGTGFGLFISKKIINLHRGKIEVRSSLETGTEFVLTLPVSSEPRDPNMHLPDNSRECF